MKRIYLDYNATTPLSEEVKQFYIDALETYANGSSLHEEGRTVAKSIECARKQVASLAGAAPEEIIFNSGGSESNNTVMNTMINESKIRGRNVIVTTAIEHPCVLEASKRLSSFGLEVIYLPVDEYGAVKIDAYQAALEKKPLLVSVMTANNEIGTIQDIPLLTKMAHAAGSLFHTDAVQAAGKIPVNVHDWDVDYATFSAHKIYGPKGVGALFVKKGAPLESFVRGGHQEHGMRAGTYNGPAIAAFGLAAELAKNETPKYGLRMQKLRNMLKDGLLKNIPDIRVNGHPENVLPNTLDVSFPGAEGEAILLHLDLLGIDVSTGSACASGSLEPSHVLMATGMGPELAHGSIRFSFGKYNTEADVTYILSVFPQIIADLRKMSTVR